MAVLTRELEGVTPYTGGIGVHFAALRKGLLAGGHSVSVFLPRIVGLSLSDSNKFVIVPDEARPLDGLLAPKRRAIAFDRAVARNGPFDVVVAPEWGGWASELARTWGSPPVITVLATSLAQIRKVEPQPYGQALRVFRDRLQMSLEQSQAERSRGVIAVSSTILQWSESLWDLADIPSRVVPNCLDIAATRTAAAGLPNRVALDADAPWAIFTGRLCAWKGIETLSAALREVWREEPDLHVAFAGRVDNRGRESYEQWLRSQLSERSRQLRFFGHLPRTELLPLLRQATFATFPSRFEAFGLGALEARAIGTPIIATSGTGFSEFCRDGVDAELVPPDSPHELAEAMLRLIRRPELRDKYSKAAATDAMRYDALHVSNEFATTLEALLVG